MLVFQIIKIYYDIKCIFRFERQSQTRPACFNSVGQQQQLQQYFRSAPSKGNITSKISFWQSSCLTPGIRNVIISKNKTKKTKKTKKNHPHSPAFYPRQQTAPPHKCTLRAFMPDGVRQRVAVHMTCIIPLCFGYTLHSFPFFFFPSSSSSSSSLSQELRPRGQTAGVPYIASCKKYLGTPHPN